MISTENDRAAPAIVWLRRDLRTSDNPALLAAAEAGPVIPLYILENRGGRADGGAARWWLHHSLAALGRSLADLGSPLVLRRGTAVDVIEALAATTGASALHFNRRYDEEGRNVDRLVRTSLERRGIAVHDHAANLVFEPDAIATGSGGFYRVFTPFWRAVSALPPPRAPRPAPKQLRPPAPYPKSEPLDCWHLLPKKPDWAVGFGDLWQPGEAGAQARMATFMKTRFSRYAVERDRPDRSATSMLSPHLAFGEISPFAIWEAVDQASDASKTSITKFRQELVWREFSHHLLFHFPQLAKKNFNPSFDAFPWAIGGPGLGAWQRGETGHPIVDAGMRQLWQTGWMHNRVRMIVASFLVKDLLFDWRCGEAWFWETLVDADLAANAANWQWVAGSGADAAPYFRIFNPILQAEKFDPDGAYVRRFVPELAALPDRLLHQPWKATDLELAAAGISLGKTYPYPIVDHKIARERALRAFAKTKDAD